MSRHAKPTAHVATKRFTCNIFKRLWGHVDQLFKSFRKQQVNALRNIPLLETLEKSLSLFLSSNRKFPNSIAQLSPTQKHQSAANDTKIIFLVFSNLDIVFSLLHRDYTTNEGKNLTIPCGDTNPSIWTRDGSNITSNYNLIIVSVTKRPPKQITP